MDVLVVDDSLDLQRSLATLLASIPGVRIVGYAEDADGAVAMVDRLLPEVIVLDVELRGQSRGVDVLRHVVREQPQIKVVMLTNFSRQAMRDGLTGAGACACFDKSNEFVEARDFIAALAAAAHGRQGGPV